MTLGGALIETKYSLKFLDSSDAVKCEANYDQYILSKETKEFVFCKKDFLKNW